MTIFLSLESELHRFVGHALGWISNLVGLPMMSAVAAEAAAVEPTQQGNILASISGNLNQMIQLVILGILLILAVFGVLAVVISMLNYEENPVRDRLNMFKEKGIFEKTNRKVGAFDDLTESLIVLAGPIGQALYGKSQKQIKLLLTEAGLPDGDNHVGRFMAKRAAVGLVCAAVLLVVSVLFLPTFTAVATLGGFVIGSMWPRFSLVNQAKVRKNEIRFNLPDTLDLMVVCVEAGLGLDSTIQRVAEESERMAPEISMEFKRLNKELNAGISRLEAFHSLGQRAGVDELRSLCAMIIQADKMGTSVADTLRVFSEDLRTKRRQKAEELAAQASIKMIFPLVFFIFPPLFLVLLGPMMINVYNQFFVK